MEHAGMCDQHCTLQLTKWHSSHERLLQLRALLQLLLLTLLFKVPAAISPASLAAHTDMVSFMRLVS